MKSIRMILGKVENFAASSSAGDGSFSVAINLSSVTPLTVVSFAANNTSYNNSGENYNGPVNFTVRFNSTLVIIIFGMFALLSVIGFFLIFIFFRSTDEGRDTSDPTRAGGTDIVKEMPTRGLDKTVIESFPVFSYSLVKGLKSRTKGSECAVCLSDFEEEEMLRLLSKCSHAFHPECIDMWLYTHTTCPICRTSLLPGDDSISNPTDTDFGVVEPPAALPVQVAIIIDSGGGVSRRGSARGDLTNEEATDGNPCCDSMGHSLVRVRKEPEQPTEWYIATAGGLKPGLRRSCTFVGKNPSQEPSSSNDRRAWSKPGESGRRSKLERRGSIPVNPASLLKSFSERISTRPGVQAGFERLI